MRAFPVAQIGPNLHKIVSSRIKVFPVTQVCSNSHKIVIRAFPVAQIRPNLHKIVSSRVRTFPVAQFVTVGLLKKDAPCPGSRSERGGARRAPTKRVLIYFSRVFINLDMYWQDSSSVLRTYRPNVDLNGNFVFRFLKRT